MPNDNTITTIEQFRAFRGDGSQAVYRKSVGHVDEHIRNFLALTPFITVASIDADGHMDISPKGDPPGFIKVIDEKTIAIPERAGNRRADTFTNILQNPAVALICLVPGMDETMRINGTASISTDPELLQDMEEQGHVPALAMLVHIEEAFIHCGKAPKRAKLWDPESRIDRSIYPRIGEVMHDHGTLDDIGVPRDVMVDRAQDDYDNWVYPKDEDA